MRNVARPHIGTHLAIVVFGLTLTPALANDEGLVGNPIRHIPVVGDLPFVGPLPVTHRADDGMVGEQYALDMVQAYDAWSLELGDPTIIVAVIDSGVDGTHADIADRMWSNPRETANGIDDDGNGFIDDLHGWDFVDNDPNPQDETGHGTHIAGVIAARGRFTGGVAGMANVTIMPIRVLDAEQRGTDTGTQRAIDYAVANGARVINVSLGGTNLNASLEEACRRAWEQGVIVVAAAGNQGAEVLFPAKYDNVIGVGAVDDQHSVPTFSNRGAGLDLVAPGLAVLSTLPDGRYGYRSGTSVATAHVTAAAALLLSADPSLDADTVRVRLLDTATEVGVVGWDDASGFGLVNAFEALKATDLRIARAQPASVSGTQDANDPLDATPLMPCGFGIAPGLLVSLVSLGVSRANRSGRRSH